MRCDATQSGVDVECNYMKTLGTSYTREVSEHMSISSGVSYSISQDFFGIFSSEIGTAVNTGYDWSEASSATTGEEEHFEVLNKKMYIFEW